MDVIFLALGWICKVYSYIIIVAVILSWVRARPDEPIVKLINDITEPVFDFVRKKIPPKFLISIDISPLIVLFLLSLLEGFFYSIARFGFSLKLILAIIIEGVINIVAGVMLIYVVIIVLYILGPYINLKPYSPFGIIVRNLVDLLAEPLRRYIPATTGRVDLAPFLLCGMLIAGYLIVNYLPRLLLGVF